MNTMLAGLRGKCSCGREHSMQVRDMWICHDALKMLEGLLTEGELSFCKKPVIICDTNTLAAAKDQLTEVLAHVPVVELSPVHLHADNAGVAKAEALVPADTDLILAVGSGTIHDISRYLAHKMGIDFVSCPTAASVDGFVSTVAAMTWDGMKATLPAVSPIYVVADTSVISRAPYRLTASGMADLFGKYTAIADWKIAHAVTGEYICQRLCDMEMEAIDEVRACMADLKNGSEEPYAKLMSALLLSGLAMQMVGNSRPASCAEHHISHLWEMAVLNEDVDALHGEKVGVGLRLAVTEYKRIGAHLKAGTYKLIPWEGLEMDKLEASFGKKGLMEGVLKENVPDPLASITTDQIEAAKDAIIDAIDELPSPEDVEALLRDGGCPVTVEDIHLTEDIIPDTLTLSPYVRNRLSFMRLKKMIATC